MVDDGHFHILDAASLSLCCVDTMCCAGSLSSCFVQSIDYTRTRSATDARNSSGKHQFNGIIDVYVKTLKTDGIAGLYRGFLVSCVCIFIYRGLYFGLYDSLKPMLLSDKPFWFHTFLLGWAVTITAGFVSKLWITFYAKIDSFGDRLRD